MSELPITWFDYELPSELIAQEPARPRDASRLLVLTRASGAVRHAAFCDLPELLEAGDLLVVNRTRVIPARLHLRKATGGRVELLLVRPVAGSLMDATQWEALARPTKGLNPGAALEAPSGGTLTVAGRKGELVLVNGPVWRLLEEHGEMPLPPYIERPRSLVLNAGPSDSERRGCGCEARSRGNIEYMPSAEQRSRRTRAARSATGGIRHQTPRAGRTTDRDDYQTVFAREPGAVAAPTAGLHFTEAVLGALEARGIGVAHITLHVGPGTFLPVRQEHYADVRGHEMQAEWFEVPKETAAAMAGTRAHGHRVVAVGTTTVRALETSAQTGAQSGESRLFIYPGFAFRAVDALLTNFHLPRSTLLMLVAALAGRESVLAAYREAVRRRYRFFSYGDAMLVL